MISDSWVLTLNTKKNYFIPSSCQWGILVARVSIRLDEMKEYTFSVESACLDVVNVSLTPIEYPLG